MNETVETIFTAFTKLALFDGMPMLFVLRMKRVQKTHNFFEGAKKNIGNYTSIEIAAFVDGRGGSMHRGMWAFLIRLIIEEKEMKCAELATRNIRALADESATQTVKVHLPKPENRDDDPKSLYSVYAARVRSWNRPQQATKGDWMGSADTASQTCLLVFQGLSRLPSRITRVMGTLSGRCDGSGRRCHGSAVGLSGCPVGLSRAQLNALARGVSVERACTLSKCPVSVV